MDQPHTQVIPIFN
uniref:Uncharacterized protein n=1 Tax=Rhizophora mucronata TaxID=61149 RepID=A0A2P2NWB0_RHIMU